MRLVETQAKREGWMKWRSYLLRYFHVKFAFCLNGVGRGCDVVKRDNHFRNSHVTRGVGQQPWNTYIEQTNILSLNLRYLRIDQWVSWFSTSIHWCFRGLICRWVPAALACGNPILIFPLPSGKRTKNYGKSPFLMGKSTISMVIFNSYVKLPEGNPPKKMTKTSPEGKLYRYQKDDVFILYILCLWAGRCDSSVHHQLIQGFNIPLFS